MRIGFGKVEISPPVGTALGGYAGYRPCAGIHDPLYARAAVLEQQGVLYALVALDLMCVDEGLYLALARALEPLGICRQRLIACAIHSHAAPAGMVPGQGPLACVNKPEEPEDPAFREYMDRVICRVTELCRRAAQTLEPFRVRTARAPVPPVGSERHTGTAPRGQLTVVQCRTESGKVLTVYNFPCHPTVLSAGNLLVSADFAGAVEQLLDEGTAIFLNGAAGDISTRFTRQEASFAECRRLGAVAARAVQACIRDSVFREPEPLTGIHCAVTAEPRPVLPEQEALEVLDRTTRQWQQALQEGADPLRVRLLKSLAEGAGVSLQFSRTMGGIRQLRLPVTVFRFAALTFAAVPGELFSTLAPEGMAVIGYANGYYRYICGQEAYREHYYEAMASILARGEGEKLARSLEELAEALQDQRR